MILDVSGISDNDVSRISDNDVSRISDNDVSVNAKSAINKIVFIDMRKE